MFIFSVKLLDDTASIFKFTPLTLWHKKKMIVKYFYISLIDIIKIIFVTKLDKMKLSYMEYSKQF